VTALSIAVIGDGRMGRAVREAAMDAGDAVVAVIGRGDVVTGGTLRGATVAIEFTEPGEAPANVRACVDAGCPIVVGTTGWYAVLPDITSYVNAHGGTLLWAPNFSLGVAVLAELVRHAASLTSHLAGVSAAFVEVHHAAKKDAPSGTALALAGAWAAVAGSTPPVTSVRVGHVPGTHELLLDSRYEQLTLRHEARDRRVFADGALAAARWLQGRRGVFTLSDVLQIAGRLP